MLHLASHITTSGTLGGRNYDYTKKYDPETPGEEVKGNARIWNVYLDEAGDYDADMIQGFRNIIDGLLVFAALFSAVVTAFVAQTSRALQPDNAQITVSLLVEIGQLLRAGGNGTIINAVPAASLGRSQTCTSIDVWVNGLFSTSLALSLSTALLSVLAKQWIQAYITVVPGDARTRALTRQFRFEGLKKWKLGDIIESLPLILHCSVAVFLVGLTLYISQLSKSICGVVAGITALTFVVYFGSSMIPALDIACPYRISCMFRLAQQLGFAFQVLPFAYLYPFMSGAKYRWPEVPRKSLRRAEKDKVLAKYYSLHLSQNSLCWVYNYSSNHSVKEIVIEGACGLLSEWEHYLYTPISGNLLSSTIKYSFSRLLDLSSTSSIKEGTVYGRLVEAFVKIFPTLARRDAPIMDLKMKELLEVYEQELFRTYQRALCAKKHMLSRCLLDWADPKLLRSDSERHNRFLMHCASFGDPEDFRDLLDRGLDLHYQFSDGWTVLHTAVSNHNVDGVIFIIDQVPALISVPAKRSETSVVLTPLDLAIDGHHPEHKFNMVAYLLEHGAKSLFHNTLYCLLNYDIYGLPIPSIQLLLDCGWDRTVKDTEGKTLLDVARSQDNPTLVDYLEHYQTARIPPHGEAISHSQ